MSLFARFRSSHSFGGAGTICRSRPSYGIAGRCIRRQVVGGLFVVVRGHDPQSVVGLVGLRKAAFNEMVRSWIGSAEATYLGAMNAPEAHVTRGRELASSTKEAKHTAAHDKMSI